MKFSFHHVIEQDFHFLATAFSKSKIMVVQLIVTISSRSFSQIRMHLTHINCITDNVFIREACTLTLSRLFNRLRTPITPILFFNFRYLFNTNWKRSNRPSHSLDKCQQTMSRLSWLRDVCYLKKRNMKRPRINSKKLLTSKAISAMSATTLLFATIR